MRGSTVLHLKLFITKLCVIGGVVVKSIVNISNRGSNIENRTENKNDVSSHP